MKLRHPHLIHPNYRPDIDGLRAIAVLSVLIFHVFPDTLKGGFVGVDIFFVISGYLISTILYSSLERDRFSLAEFYIRRIKRIFPALILVMFTCLVTGWFMMVADEYKQLGKHLAAGAVFISNFALWGESGYFDQTAATKPLLHLWSLSIEEQFYLLWPLLLALVWKRRWNFLAITATIVLLSLCASVYLAYTNPVAAFYSPLSRCWELLAGGLLAWMRLHRPEWLERRQNLQSVTGLALIAAGIVLLDKNRVFPGLWALLPVLGVFLVISAGPQAKLNVRLLSNKAMVGIGLISYPLYLWHWPLLSFASLIGVHDMASRALVIPASIVLAWLTYRFVECPVRNGRPFRFMITGLCICMTLIALIGHNIYSRDGLSFRLNTLIGHLTATDLDVHKAFREDVCFLGHTQREFSQECSDALDGPRLFLWGDSHAAAMYPGLKQLQQQKRFAISQYNAAACPPLLTETQDERCKLPNERAFAVLSRERPDIVVLHANWSRKSLQAQEQTVRRIRDASPGSRILLVGPVPHWNELLSKLVWLYWREHHEILPVRTHYGMSEKTAGLDKAAAVVAANLTIDYFSAYGAMCDENGCMTQTESKKLTTFDNEHLTPSASAFLATRIFANIFEPR